MPKFKESMISWDGTHFRFKEGVLGELKKTFWDKDVEEEIRKAERWLQYNHAKKRFMRFLCNWLNNARVTLNFKERKSLNETPGQFRTGVQSQPRSIGDLLTDFMHHD